MTHPVVVLAALTRRDRRRRMWRLVLLGVTVLGALALLPAVFFGAVILSAASTLTGEAPSAADVESAVETRVVPAPSIDPSGDLAMVPTSDGVLVVAADLAPQLQAMIVAAERDGVHINRGSGGGGWRSSADQIRVRRNNCGDGWYNIYQKPASACRPPAARPGTSQHEIGLAVDLSCDGTLIGSRNNVCFRWLSAHAADFGLYNLPSEPWHWSTTGR